MPEDRNQRLPTKPNDSKETKLIANTQRLFPATSSTLIHHIQKGDPTTRESFVARFCVVYYPAIYSFARMRGLDVGDAEDRTQDFFMEVIKDELLMKFDPAHGSRFSSWLMTCFRNMELNHRAAQSAKKRGGDQEFVSYDTDFAERCHQHAQMAQLSEASAVDLALARSLWRSTQARLRARHLGTMNEVLVHELMPQLLLDRWPDPPALTQDQMAKKHGTTAVRLKAFFNRTLKTQAERFFREEAIFANPGINDEEIAELWSLVRTHQQG
ncbi:MAG: sigma-70 family RNA polymerase sigma factor [Verrucomicrobiaceae bacterium]|nr:sigma-70 family RNA polymerase sigma factor [Verrucomicrobiaceae bacterium]